jgi:hypothetical protein
VRELSDQEFRAAADRLAAAWDVGRDYWFPLSSVARADVLAFQDAPFRDELAAGPLQALLRSREVERAWELREWGPSYEVPVEGVDPEYTGAEGFWCTATMDWVLYASHESSITVGGRWLIDAVRRAWPAWADHVWPGPRST